MAFFAVGWWNERVSGWFRERFNANKIFTFFYQLYFNFEEKAFDIFLWILVLLLLHKLLSCIYCL